MFKVTKYPHGTFSWAECTTTDADKAKSFYAGLMDWDYDDIPFGDGMVYTMYKSDGETVSALNQMQPDMQSQGVPSHWASYITVDDVDALESKVKELGGTVIAPPFDVMEEGRMMVVVDPTGANISFWQAKNHIGASLVNTPGAMTWNELYTSDAAAAKDFYGKLLGWQFHQMEGMDNYFMILNNGRSNGGIMQITPEMGPMPPNWVVYFSVADIEATVKKAGELGGTVQGPIHDAGSIGRFAMIQDPSGAMATMIQLTEPQPWDVN